MDLRLKKLSKASQHVKIIRTSKKDLNAFGRRSTIAPAWTDPAESISPQHDLAKSRVFQSDPVQPKPLTSTPSISKNYESEPINHTQSINLVDKSSTAISSSPKFECSKMGLIILVVFLGICALTGLAIGLYFLISGSMKTTSTTMNTKSTCTMTLCWNSSGSTVLGTGSSGASSDHFNNPFYLQIDSSGSFYVADGYNNRIQKFTATSLTGTTVAGQASGQWGTTAYYFNQPTCILKDPNGNLYVSDAQNYRVQYFASGSLLGVTIAGTGTYGSTLPQLNTARGLALDSTRGILYIADSNNHRIVSFPSSGGSGTVVAGGNGGGSISNQLNSPIGLYLDTSSNSLYIANCNSHNIVRWVLNASTWTLVVGNPNGQSGYTTTTLSSPTDLTFDYMGNLYVTDSGNQRIQFFLSGQTNGTTIAGIAGVTASTAYAFSGPQSAALDSNLNLYVVDTANNRIQKFQRYY